VDSYQCSQIFGGPDGARMWEKSHEETTECHGATLKRDSE
jgi:hypothetical protein